MAFSLSMAAFLTNASHAKGNRKNIHFKDVAVDISSVSVTDTIPPEDVMDVITVVINSSASFDIDALANLYTPNAVIADDEPPYSWNGPTAGVQWVHAIEKACKDNRITKLKGEIDPVNFFQQSADNIYIIVPVSYTGNFPGKRHFAVKGAFTFVLRLVNGKWLIKSQAWMQQKGMTGSAG
jgi:ketosteroid isomerase-like protein